LEGDILVWREVLAEGLVVKTDLWSTQTKWICNTFGETEANYREKVLNELEKLKNINTYHKVVLWFEYDLVCQINLIYILSVLKETSSPGLSIELIYPDRFDNIPNFRGLGELNSTQLNNFIPQEKTEHKRPKPY